MNFFERSYAAISAGFYSEPTDYAIGTTPCEDFFKFVGMLLLFFGIACLLVIGIMVYKGRRRKQLTDPRKDHVYKKSNH